MIKSNRGIVLILALLAAAIVAGPVIFYGLVALGDAGAFQNMRANFWIVVPAGIVLVLALWVAILFLGSRLAPADAPNKG
jgi:hypothetical protein